MLLLILITNSLLYVIKCDQINSTKLELVVQIPLELPNRNDRADQCWIRIEDVELTETLSIYCHLAQEFLRSFIHDYNNRKMIEDNVDVSLWSELPRPHEDIPTIKYVMDKQNDIVDWKLTTVMDPTTRQRLYVTHNAVCRLIMYSREGISNYKVDCDRILYFVNVRLNVGVASTAQVKMIAVTLIAVLLNYL